MVGKQLQMLFHIDRWLLESSQEVGSYYWIDEMGVTLPKPVWLREYRSSMITGGIRDGSDCVPFANLHRVELREGEWIVPLPGPRKQ
jgi:hypothetical protein